MTPQERRGKRLFLVLATLIILEKLAGLAITLTAGLAEINWLRSVLQPVAFALAVAFLWQGDTWLRWLVGAACLLSGGLLAFICGRVLLKLAGETPPAATEVFMQVVGYPIGLVGVYGLLYVLAGLLFLFSPSLRAFFRYQREVRWAF